MTSRDIMLPNQPLITAEETAVREIFELDPAELTGTDVTEYEGLVTIVNQFSRVNPETGEHEFISPSRIAAIPSITARHCELIRPARGDLTPFEVTEAWQSNMPTNDGTRHPDLLFDIAQYNFGTDEPLDYVVHSLTRAERQRREMIERYKSAARQAITRYRYEQDINDNRSEAEFDEFIESIV